MKERSSKLDIEIESFLQEDEVGVFLSHFAEFVFVGVQKGIVAVLFNFCFEHQRKIVEFFPQGFQHILLFAFQSALLCFVVDGKQNVVMFINQRFAFGECYHQRIFTGIAVMLHDFVPGIFELLRCKRVFGTAGIFTGLFFFLFFYLLTACSEILNTDGIEFGQVPGEW